MSSVGAFNLREWVDNNRDKLKPPVGNIEMFPEHEFIVMIVGGPNARSDYHVNNGEEFFYQIEGNINLRIMEGGTPRDIIIREGDVLLLPSNVPHSPQRPAGTIGMVVERKRADTEIDYLRWYCDSCNELVHEASFHLKDIVAELKAIFEEFYGNEEMRTCKNCGHVLPIPEPAVKV
jgi:3-hydroxyanthranilate 3,4-dioxygenase